MGGMEQVLMRQNLPEERRRKTNLKENLHFHHLKTLLILSAQTHTTSETKSQLRRAQQIEGVETAANTQLGKTAAPRRISQHRSFTSAKGIWVLLTCPLIDWAPVYKNELPFHAVQSL